MQDRNFYEILGVKQDATINQVKKAYKKLAVQFHPDKTSKLSLKEQEVALEKFQQINTAHETLIDDLKRNVYDKKIAAKEITLEPAEPEALTSFQRWNASRLTTPNRPLSEIFKQSHAKVKAEYSRKPLTPTDPSEFLNNESEALYQNQETNQSFPNLFLYLQSKNKSIPKHFKFDFQELNIEVTFRFFLNFLRGDIYGKDLQIFINLLDDKIQSINANIKKDNNHATQVNNFRNELEANLYQGMLDILSMGVTGPTLDDRLAIAIQKISDYAKHYAKDSQAIIFMTPVLQSPYFRSLFSFAINSYWRSDIDICEDQYLSLFNGMEKTKELFEKNKEEIFSDHSRSEELIPLFKTLYKFEKTTHEFVNDKEENIDDFYRKKAFLILDWYKAFASLVPLGVVTNTLFQAGIYFQKASQHAKTKELQMADESIAYECYLVAHHYAQESSPDISLYLHIHTLKCLLNFQFDHKDLKEVISAIQKRAEFISNIFPFFQMVTSNAEIFHQKNIMLILMREFLNALYNILIYNETAAKQANLDHSRVSILYHVFDGCLASWFMENFDPEFLEQVRQKLMRELLTINRWTFEHIKANLTGEITINPERDFPRVTVKRDTQGWLATDKDLLIHYSSSLSKSQQKFFRGIRGLELNYKTGQVEYLFAEATNNNSYTEELVSTTDLTQLLVNRTTYALFSLDQIDPLLRHHPFMKMFIKPSNLYASELSKVMALSDIILKNLTVGWQVQAQEPFEQRPLDSIISKMPAYLKKIITDVQLKDILRKFNSIHRFWFQAVELEYEETQQEEVLKDGIKRLGFNRMIMAVFTHFMIRDEHGNLIDGSQNEGWSMYAIPLQEIAQHIDHIESPAMIWIDKDTVCLFEDGVVSKPIQLDMTEELITLLLKLFKLKKDAHNKFIVDDFFPKLTVYSLIRKIQEQINIDHHYSKEAVFAWEFTIHYDEFAMYLPILARLKELSIAVMTVRILEGERQDAIQNIERYKKRIDKADTKFWKEMNAKITATTSTNVRNNFNKWVPTCQYEVIKANCMKRLQDLQNEIGDTWNVNKRISSIRSQFEAEVSRQGFSFYHSEVQEHWRKQVQEIENATRQNRSNLLSELKQAFSNLPITDYILNAFIDGDSTSLLEIMINDEVNGVKDQLQQVYSHTDRQTLWTAVNGSQSAIETVISNQIEEEKRNVMTELHRLMNQTIKLNHSFEEMGLKGDDEIKFDLSHTCPWVPASMHYDYKSNTSNVVYGGVAITGSMNITNAAQGLLIQQFSAQNYARMPGSAQLEFNQRVGNGWRDAVAGTFVQMGFTVQKEVTVQTPWGARRHDMQLFRQDGTSAGYVETKVNSSRYADHLQRQKDLWIREQYGPNHSTTVMRHNPSGKKTW